MDRSCIITVAITGSVARKEHNSPRLLAQPFARFLEAKIRELEPYPGLPILLTCRARTSASS